MKNNFNDFRFEGLNYKKCSNKYFTMDRVSADENKIVVKVGESHLIETRYGFALILDNTHVVFLKKWQVNRNYFGNEILLVRDFFKPTEWGTHDEFIGEENYCDFNAWLGVAKEQRDFVDEEGNKNKALWKINDRKDEQYAY